AYAAFLFSFPSFSLQTPPHSRHSQALRRQSPRRRPSNLGSRALPSQPAVRSVNALNCWPQKLHFALVVRSQPTATSQPRLNASAGLLLRTFVRNPVHTVQTRR
ncbi:hypothetical protein AKJ16_DCAP27604, partial [Drosera capensis]